MCSILIGNSVYLVLPYYCNRLRSMCRVFSRLLKTKSLNIARKVVHMVYYDPQSYVVAEYRLNFNLYVYRTRCIQTVHEKLFSIYNIISNTSLYQLWCISCDSLWLQKSVILCQRWIWLIAFIKSIKLCLIFHFFSLDFVVVFAIHPWENRASHI